MKLTISMIQKFYRLNMPIAYSRYSDEDKKQIQIVTIKINMFLILFPKKAFIIHFLESQHAVKQLLIKMNGTIFVSSTFVRLC